MTLRRTSQTRSSSLVARLLPVVALALGLAIPAAFALYELARDVDALDIGKPSPLRNRYEQQEFPGGCGLDQHVCRAISRSSGQGRELANELAHGLRTPLAAISLRAHALRLVPSGPERELLLTQLERDALRSGQVLAGSAVAGARQQGRHGRVWSWADIWTLLRAMRSPALAKARIKAATGWRW